MKEAGEGNEGDAVEKAKDEGERLGCNTGAGEKEERKWRWEHGPTARKTNLFDFLNKPF